MLAGRVHPGSIPAKVTLAWALATDLLSGDAYRKVHVRGCGFAGAAFARTAVSLGRDVTVYGGPHPHDVTFRPQVGSKRYLDPTIYRWPEKGWEESTFEIALGAGVSLTLAGRTADLEVQTWRDALHREWSSARRGAHPWQLTGGDLPPPDDANLYVDATGPGASALHYHNGEQEVLMTGAGYWELPANRLPTGGEVHVIGAGDGALQEAILLLTGLNSVRPLVAHLVAAVPHHGTLTERQIAACWEPPPPTFAGKVVLHRAQDPFAPSDGSFAANRVIAQAYLNTYPGHFALEPLAAVDDHALLSKHEYRGFDIVSPNTDPWQSVVSVRFGDKTLPPLPIDSVLLRIGPNVQHDALNNVPQRLPRAAPAVIGTGAMYDYLWE